MEDTNKDKEMTAAEVRFALDEIENAYGHLQRSQTELKEYLEAEADDEINQAYMENKHVLIKKRARAKELYELLEAIDPAYFTENQQALRLIRDHLAFDTLTDDEIQAANSMLRELNNQGLPIEIVMNGERQYQAEARILSGESQETNGDDGGEPRSSEGLYL